MTQLETLNVEVTGNPSDADLEALDEEFQNALHDMILTNPKLKGKIKVIDAITGFLFS